MESHGPKIVGTIFESACHLLGGAAVIDYLRRNLITGGQVQQGDDFMDQSRDLLQRHLELMQLKEQNTIREDYLKAVDVKEKLDDHNGSQVQKFFQARKYKRRARKAFKIVKKASDRAVDTHLMDRIAENTRGFYGEPGNSAGTGPVEPTPRDPFTDSNAISTLTDIASSLEDVDQVDVSTFQNEETGDSAVVWDFHGRDSITQHIVSTFPTEASSGDMIDGEASQSAPPGGTVALSLHKEDGSTPRLVTAPLHNVDAR